MQVCKKLLSSGLFFGLAACWCDFAAAPLAAQTAASSSSALEMPSMPSMPEMLEMPEITDSARMPSKIFSSAAASTGSVYSPGFSQGTSASSQSGNSASSKNGLAESISGASKASSASALAAGSTGSSISDVLSDFLTADDISTLYDSGLFGSLSSLTGTGAAGIVGTGNSAASASRLTGSADSETTNQLLRQVLESLNELKSLQSNESPEEKQKLASIQKDSEYFKTRSASILRFKINGYNIADSLTKVFFSEAEPDGTFLLTADRKYYLNQQARTETFYILFKAVKNSGSAVTFSVTPEIIQDYPNENSFVYKFSKMENLTAQKTGNLVVLHSSQNDLTAEMLLDIDVKN